jgi:SAM-dependent methyltransferase
MGRDENEWYKNAWSLDIKNMSWTENTEKEVGFLIRAMGLSGGERILDLACGFGRHSLAFAERGYDVTGVDITPEFIEDARKTAKARRLHADFICADIRDVDFRGEFDVVLNLADGAVGYLENDEENLKIFDVISRALRPGGKHFMDICSREHAEKCFPAKAWEIGAKSLSLADFGWDETTKRMLYGEAVIPFGELAQPPVLTDPRPGVRLYNKEELRDILAERGMSVLQTFSDYDGSLDSYKKIQLMVYSQKAGK